MTSRVVRQSQTLCPLQPAGNVKHRVVTQYATIIFQKHQVHAKHISPRFRQHWTNYLDCGLFIYVSFRVEKTLPRWWNVDKNVILAFDSQCQREKSWKEGKCNWMQRHKTLFVVGNRLETVCKEQMFESRSSGAVSGSITPARHQPARRTRSSRGHNLAKPPLSFVRLKHYFANTCRNDKYIHPNRGSPRTVWPLNK